MLAFSTRITIAGRTISPTKKPLVIAELSGNHGGYLSNALELIDACAAGGAEMVKFQSYTPDTITLKSDNPDFIVKNDLWKDRTLYNLYTDAHTPFDWHADLFDHTRKRGMIPISSPFDHSAVDLLEQLDCPAYKIASCELVDFDLINRVAATGKPIIVSTGAAALSEIEDALYFLSDLGVRDLLLFHCISEYPTRAKDANLATIQALVQRFNCLVGFSDHTQGLTVPVSAVALGAVAIEKHVRLDSDTTSVDSAFSLKASDIKKLKRATSRAWKSLGQARQLAFDCESESLRFRRSLYVSKGVKEGETFTRSNLRSVRPAGGMHTKYLEQILGRRAACDIAKATPLIPELIKDWTHAKNILITSAASKIPLIQLFQKAAEGKHIQIIAADMNPECQAAQCADAFFTLPKDSDPFHKQALLHLCDKHNIGMIIPTRDSEMVQLASYSTDLQRAGILLPLPPLDKLKLCLDKIDFYDDCLKQGFPVLPRMIPGKTPESTLKFPVFMRARNSAASRDAQVIKNRTRLTKIADVENKLIQPFIDAPEYSCDILSDMKGHVQHVIVRQRLVVKKGESTHSRIENKPELARLATKIATHLSLKGHSLIQFFDHPTQGPLVIEVNARFGGCSHLSITGGLNSPEHMIQMMLGTFESNKTIFNSNFGMESLKKGSTITYKTTNAP